MTTVSVVIPTYYRTDVLCSRSLPSVLHQSRPVDEIIIVADGMEEDAFDDLASGVRMAGDARISLYNIARQVYPAENAWGLLAVDARNAGLDHALGEWVSLLDDDDEMLPANVATLLDAADKTGADMVYGQSMTFKSGNPTGQVYGQWPPGDGNITHGAFLMARRLGYRYRADCYERGLNADADLWTRMFNDGVSFAHVPVIVHRYHRNWP